MNPIAEKYPYASKLARACGVTRQLAHYWIKGAQHPSVRHAAGIELASGGLIRAEELWPDVQFKRDRKGRIVGYYVSLKVAA